MRARVAASIFEIDDVNGLARPAVTPSATAGAQRTIDAVRSRANGRRIPS
jgi:hypothetical protein